MASSLCCQCRASRLDQVSFVPIGELRVRGLSIKSCFGLLEGFPASVDPVHEG